MANRFGISRSLLLAGLIACMGAAVGEAAAQDSNSIVKSDDCVIEPGSIVDVGSPVEGILRFAGTKRGALIKKGDVLARLDSDLQKAEIDIARLRATATAEIESSTARLEHLRGRLQRVEQLYQKKVVPTEKLYEARTEVRLAELAVKEAGINSDLRKLELVRAKELLNLRTIRSPVSGIVVQRLLAPGEFVHEQSPLATIAEMDPLNVEVFVPIAVYPEIKLGMLAEVRPEAPVGGIHLAVVAIVDRVFDAASGTFGVRLELPNPTLKLPAGLKCQVSFAAPENMR